MFSATIVATCDLKNDVRQSVCKLWNNEGRQVTENSYHFKCNDINRSSCFYDTFFAKIKCFEPDRPRLTLNVVTFEVAITLLISFLLSFLPSTSLVLEQFKFVIYLSFQLLVVLLWDSKICTRHDLRRVIGECSVVEE